MDWCLGLPLLLLAAYLLNGWEERRRNDLHDRANWEWSKREDVWLWQWRVNYTSMRAIYEFNVFAPPGYRSVDEYLVRREEGRWERLLTPESRDRGIAELRERLERTDPAFGDKSDLRAELRKLEEGPRWERFETDLEADLEEHFRQSHKPLREWRRWAKARDEIYKAARNSDRRAA